MLPTAYEFHWDIGHLVFLGIFYTVVATVLSALAVAFYRGLRDLNRRNAVAIEWEENFHDLPPERLRCRHAMDGSTPCRTCQHGFDCGSCPGHREFMEAGGPAATGETAQLGLDVGDRRLHHRGHTWAEAQPDGSFTVGLDEFARRCFGRPVRVTPPEPGQALQTGQRCVTVERGALSVRLPAPIAGRVEAVGAAGDDWLFKVRPMDENVETAHLLQGDEARRWMLRELEWLQGVLGGATDAPSLADGGTPVDDLVRACPHADWDNIWGLVCLEC